MKRAEHIRNKVNEMVIGLRHGAIVRKKESGNEMVIVVGLILVGLVLLGLFKNSLLETAKGALDNIKDATGKLFGDFDTQLNGNSAANPPAGK